VIRKKVTFSVDFDRSGSTYRYSAIGWMKIDPDDNLKLQS